MSPENRKDEFLALMAKELASMSEEDRNRTKHLLAGFLSTMMDLELRLQELEKKRIPDAGGTN